ncbi:MAG: hypothetical protein R3A79_18350 [Nannocystaceae bacterium]
MAAALRRAVEALWVLVLAALIVVPALPGDWRPGAIEAALAWTKKIGLSQRWTMYAPNPQRGMPYLSIRGRYLDGREVALEEDDALAAGWGTKWAWDKRRLDIWRAYAAMSKKSGSDHRRSWYARSVCVREARRSDDPPRFLLIDRVARSFVHPDQVRAGAEDLGPVTRKPVQKIDCYFPAIRAMVDADRERHDERG